MQHSHKVFFTFRISDLTFPHASYYFFYSTLVVLTDYTPFSATYLDHFTRFSIFIASDITMNTLFTSFSSRSPVLTMNLLLLPYLGISTCCAATREHTDLFPFVLQIRFQHSSHQLHTRSWCLSLLRSQVGTKMDLACISPLPLPLLPPCMSALCTPILCLSRQTMIHPDCTFCSTARFNFQAIPQKGDDVRVMANAVPHTLFQWSLSCLQSFFYSFHSWALYLATILLYFILPYSQAPALVLYSYYISACTYTVHTLYLVSCSINVSLWHLSGFPLVSWCSSPWSCLLFHQPCP